MQTIIEAANEFASLQNINPINNTSGCAWEERKEAMMFNAFIKGVEFAQQFIKVEDELPIAYENGDWTGERSDLVICQLKNDKYCIARLYSGKIDGFEFDDWVDSDDNYLINNVVVAWRPININ